ncbi:MAG: 50S ribosomal protein L18 [bacterium]|nr:50S ribosomal protein L18 [bacterium]
MKSNSDNRITRHKRIRAKVKGTANRPRLSVFRSNRYISGQIIDDSSGSTLVSISTRGEKNGTRVEKAEAAGSVIAKRAKEKGIKSVVFDRAGYLYAGAVKSFADGARKGGLIF